MAVAKIEIISEKLVEQIINKIAVPVCNGTIFMETSFLLFFT